MPYKIVEDTWGYTLTFPEPLSRGSAAAWLEEIREELVVAPASFHVLMDMRAQAKLTPATLHSLDEGLELCRGTGMNRLAIVTNGGPAAKTLEALLTPRGEDEGRRRVDGRASDWEELAMAWLLMRIEPDVAAEVAAGS
ncbi:MAG: hypothetical protein IT198_08315 [Acidimicrobiia bacterium]|nr:hypothetical protein [Acidimicrobiia bacterium]